VSPEIRFASVIILQYQESFSVVCISDVHLYVWAFLKKKKRKRGADDYMLR
jgi:hypothetical protein